jgi:hypothetical protein
MQFWGQESGLRRESRSRQRFARASVRGEQPLIGEITIDLLLDAPFLSDAQKETMVTDCASTRRRH